MIFQSVKKRVCDDGTDEASQAFVGKAFKDMSSHMLATQSIGRGPSAPLSSEVPPMAAPHVATPVRQHAQIPNEHSLGFVGGGGGDGSPALHSITPTSAQHSLRRNGKACAVTGLTI